MGVSLSRYVAACERIPSEAGLSVHLHACGTNVEGEWDAVITAVERCHMALHEMGAPRIVTTLRLETRTDRAQTMADKVESVCAKLTEGM